MRATVLRPPRSRKLQVRISLLMACCPGSWNLPGSVATLSRRDIVCRTGPKLAADQSNIIGQFASKSCMFFINIIFLMKSSLHDQTIPNGQRDAIGKRGYAISCYCFFLLADLALEALAMAIGVFVLLPCYVSHSSSRQRSQLPLLISIAYAQKKSDPVPGDSSDLFIQYLDVT